VSALETHTEQVGHRVRTITTGGRRGRRVTPEQVDNHLTYLDLVADNLEQHGLVVDALALDCRNPISGRLSIRTESGAPIPGIGSTISLEWQQGFGWSTTTHGPGAPRDGWFHLYADDAATSGVVTEFVLNEVMPKQPPDAKPDGPAVAR
jgi:hypothetical protein